MMKMNNKEKILKLLSKNNGLILRKELDKLNIPSIYLTILVREKKLERIGRGIYVDINSFGDDFYKNQAVSKNAVYSNNTALYLHGLSNRTPVNYDFTVPYNYNGSLMNNKTVNIFRINKSILNLGIIYMKSPGGQEIKVYDKERTICDIIKNKKKIDNEIVNEAVKKYVISNDFNSYKLNKYAKILKLEKEITKYLEVLL